MHFFFFLIDEDSTATIELEEVKDGNTNIGDNNVVDIDSGDKPEGYMLPSGPLWFF